MKSFDPISIILMKSTFVHSCLPFRSFTDVTPRRKRAKGSWGATTPALEIFDSTQRKSKRIFFTFLITLRHARAHTLAQTRTQTHTGTSLCFVYFITLLPSQDYVHRMERGQIKGNFFAGNDNIIYFFISNTRINKTAKKWGWYSVMLVRDFNNAISVKFKWF